MKSGYGGQMEDKNIYLLKLNLKTELSDDF